MKLNIEGRFKRAVRLAFIGGAVGGAMVPCGPALAQDAQPIELKGVQVTGSLIRRVDAEGSNPVTTVNRKAIEASGVTTLGQLLQQLPSLTGSTVNPQLVGIAADGGSESVLSLRGLGGDRTLVLVDGKRILDNDVNLIPVNLIDRVEVLNEGAGTVYGSDAVAGVVNFITRKRFTGTELTATTGVATDHGDGQKNSVTLTTGLSSEKAHGVFGLSYDKSGPIEAKDRDLAPAKVVYYGQLTQAPTSRIPTGLYTQGTSFTDSSGNACKQVTRVPGSTGASFDQTNFECRASLPRNQFTYDFQSENLVYTPVDRVHLFGEGDYALGDSVKIYGQGYYNHVRGHTRYAPEAFDSTTLTDANGKPLGLQISQYNQYNPFGSNVTTFKLRAVDTGDRSSEAFFNNFQGAVGFKGQVLDRFDWDVSYGVGIDDDSTSQSGFLDIAQLGQQLGPSKNGTCYGSATGTPGPNAVYSNPIANCTPINFIGTQGTRYGSLSKPVNTQSFSELQTFNATINGDLFQLPAGALSAAVGTEWRYSLANTTPDALQQQFQLSEANGLASGGGYNVREVFGELLLPILKDLPLVKQLNLTAGVRYSDYSNFGSTTNAKYGLEYRPINDLLVRATYQDVFRAPTIGDLYSAAATDSPGYTDPCNGYTGQASAAYPNLAAACQNVPTDGSYKQATPQGAAISKGNPNVGPEQGYTTDFGFVYSASWYKPLSVSADLWYYSLKDTIEVLDQNTAVQACAATGSAQYCSLFTRGADGQIFTGTEEPQNIGHLTTHGVDFGVQLNYQKTRFGSFLFATNGTYLSKYLTDINLGGGVDAGRYSTAGEYLPAGTAEGFPRFKLNSELTWSYSDFEFVLRNRFISSERDDGGQDGAGNYLGVDLASAVNGGLTDCSHTSGTVAAVAGQAGPTLCSRSTGYADYQDIQATYKAKPLHTDFTVGVYDIGDQRAPLTYGSTSAFNFDSNNFDVTGRYIYGRIKVYLK